MVELTNPLWRWISVPSQAVSLAGVEGIQTLSCKFPIAVSIHCSEIPDDIDPWYGNDNIRKFGMVRRKNGLYYGPPIWVNSADFSADLGPPLGDTVEIHMLPGIRYDVWVDPWYGLPPCSFSDGSGVYNYNNGWYFAFGAL